MELTGHTESHVGPRVAVLAEWMAEVGGSEKVTAAFLSAFPGSELWTLAAHDQEARSPLAGRLLPPETDRRLLGAIATVAWRHGSFRPAEYDVVISSHHLQTHTAATPEVPHLSYVHSPARYAWFPDQDGRARGVLGRSLAARVRAGDRRAAKAVRSYAANSLATAERMRAAWNVPARVIHPPVEVRKLAARPKPGREEFLLAVSRFIPYKRLDFAIDVAEAAHQPLTIAGSGPMKSDLLQRASRATVPVQVVDQPTDEQIRDLYSRARALVFPGVEDFGIVPVEAMASGLPVVAFAEGGACESVVDGVSGRLVRGRDLRDWKRAVAQVDNIRPDSCVEVAMRFDEEIFHRRVRAWVDECAAS